MKTLSVEKMEAVEGGGRGLACAAGVLSGMGTVWGLGAAIALGSNPLGWALLGVGAVAFGMSVANGDCSYIG